MATLPLLVVVDCMNLRWRVAKRPSAGRPPMPSLCPRVPTHRKSPCDEATDQAAQVVT